MTISVTLHNLPVEKASEKAIVENTSLFLSLLLHLANLQKVEQT